MNIKNIYGYWLDWQFRAKIISTLLNVVIWSVAALVVVNYITNINQATEQTGTQLMNLGDQTITRAAEKVSEGVKLLETLAMTPSIVDAVKQANDDRADWTPETIAQQDNAWTLELPSIEPTVQEIAGSQISTYLLDFQNSNPNEVELFVTDGKGLNIAMTDRTSDFLQADESWWISSFANGKGATYFGPVEYDKSAKTYGMKIAVPIIDPDNDQAIGVLRGTLDISVMIHTLGQVKVGQAGNVILANQEGDILYSHVPAHVMKQIPNAHLALFESGRSGWGRITDMDGKASIAAYNSLEGDLGKGLGWRLFITQPQVELNRLVLRSLLISVLASCVVATLAILLSVIILSRSIAAPLTMLTQMAQELSIGNITRDDSDPVKDRLRQRQDEIGTLSKAFDRLIGYFRAGAEASTAIANQDLTITVTPNSEKDELVVAFAKMVAGLQQVIRQVAGNATALAQAASQLAAASKQSGEATSQIAVTIQQVAVGTTQQSQDVSRTSASVERLNSAIHEVAKGAQEQAQAVHNASTAAAQISSTIQEVAAHAQSGAQGASQAADAARSGAQTIEATIAGMQTIKTKVELSAQKVREMGQRSDQIDAIVETIDEISSQTNLLALNAAIEAARVEAKGEKTVETILQQHLLGAATLVAELLASGQEIDSKALERLARQARVEQFSITDLDGVITAASNPGSLGFRFSEDPRHQSFVFRALLSQRDGVVVQPIKARDQDAKPYVFAGVSRRDCPGIVQAGICGEVVYRLGGYSRGFAVVADEIRKLAEHAKTSTKEIALLIRTIQKTVLEAVRVMEDAVRDVEGRSGQATEAGESLESILKTVETVNRQVGEIAAVIQHMDASSKGLLSTMEVVSAVVGRNIAATEGMAANSSEMTQAVENIASVSEQNSAAVEEVSASTQEVSAQMEQVAASADSLMGMAQNLQRVVAQFKLDLAAENVPQPVDSVMARTKALPVL